MGVKERLELLYKLLGYEHLSEFAADVGLKPGTAQQQANRGSIPYPVAKKYVEKAKATGVTIEWLTEGRGDPPRELPLGSSTHRESNMKIDAPPVVSSLSPQGHEGPLAGEARGPHPVPGFGPMDLRVFELFSVGGGYAMLSVEQVKTVPRPDEVAGVPDAFGVYLNSDVMEPAYLIGDFLCISPVPPPAPGKDVLLMTGKAGSPGVKTALRKLVSITDTHWVCKQLNPPKPERFDRKTWPIAHKVILRIIA